MPDLIGHPLVILSLLPCHPELVEGYPSSPHFHQFHQLMEVLYYIAYWLMALSA